MTVAFCSLISRAASVMNCSGFCLNFANVSRVDAGEDRGAGSAGELGLLCDLAEQVVLDGGTRRYGRVLDLGLRDLEPCPRFELLDFEADDLLAGLDEVLHDGDVQGLSSTLMQLRISSAESNSTW